MKIRHAMIAAVMNLFLTAGVSEAQNVLPYDFSEIDGKIRSIRAGNANSLSSIRADALQTMDFGLEILGDVLKKTSYREDIVIARWDEVRDKYLSLWANTWDWFENLMKEKKMDLTKQKEWRKQYEAFLDGVIADGEAVLYWKWNEEIYRKNLDYDIRDIPKELTELKNTVKEANTLLSEAQDLANKSGAAASDINQALSKVDMAENLVEKVSKQLEATREFVKKERSKKKTSLDSQITQTRDRLKDAASNYPDIMNRWTQEVAKWAENVDTYWELYNKTWVSWEKIVKPVMEDDLFKDYSFFKGVKYTDLTTVTEKARKSLEALK